MMYMPPRKMFVLPLLLAATRCLSGCARNGCPCSSSEEQKGLELVVLPTNDTIPMRGIGKYGNASFDTERA